MRSDEDRARYREHPIFKTDFSKPLSVLIEDIRNQLVQSRGKIDDIMSGIGWEDRFKDVEGLINCGLITLYSIKKEIVESEIKKLDAERGRSLPFRSRGIGLDICPGCFICGAEKRREGANDYLNNISAYTDSKENGEIIVRWFTEYWIGDQSRAIYNQNGAWLDYREREPNYIQVKVGCCDKHLPYLKMLDEMTSLHGRIRAKDLLDIRTKAEEDEAENASKEEQHA